MQILDFCLCCLFCIYRQLLKPCQYRHVIFAALANRLTRGVDCINTSYFGSIVCRTPFSKISTTRNRLSLQRKSNAGKALAWMLFLSVRFFSHCSLIHFFGDTAAGMYFVGEVCGMSCLFLCQSQLIWTRKCISFLACKMTCWNNAVIHYTFICSTGGHLKFWPCAFFTFGSNITTVTSFVKCFDIYQWRTPLSISYCSLLFVSCLLFLCWFVCPG